MCPGGPLRLRRHLWRTYKAKHMNDCTGGVKTKCLSGSKLMVGRLSSNPKTAKGSLVVPNALSYVKSQISFAHDSI